MLATQQDSSSTSEEKLRWAFRMYDTDSSGMFFSLLILNFCANVFNFLNKLIIYRATIASNLQQLGTIDAQELAEILSSMYEENGLSKVIFFLIKCQMILCL